MKHNFVRISLFRYSNLGLTQTLSVDFLRKMLIHKPYMHAIETNEINVPLDDKPIKTWSEQICLSEKGDSYTVSMTLNVRNTSEFTASHLTTL